MWTDLVYDWSGHFLLHVDLFPQVKAMGEHLAETDKLCAPRQMRFPDHFIDDIQALVNMLIKDITDRYIKVSPLRAS